MLLWGVCCNWSSFGLIFPKKFEFCVKFQQLRQNIFSTCTEMTIFRDFDLFWIDSFSFHTN